MEIISGTTVMYTLLKEALENNQPIIIPTDTNYNLCCLPSSTESIDLIFKYKNRKKDKPLSLFFLEPEDWKKYGSVENEDIMNLLIRHFWPGPLNIVVNNVTNFNYMLNDSNTIALGCIQNKTWREFMHTLNQPIAITSANISGTADDLLITERVAFEHMGDKVSYMLKSASPVKSTKSSTIVLINSNSSIKILRQGDITQEELESVLEKGGYRVE